MDRKPDDLAIAAFLDKLAAQPWLGRAKQWPRYLFHVTDVHNAASILESGTMLSRTRAESEGLMASDNASPDVIAQTPDEVKDCVRLYFRPKTPTFFRNEGIRPVIVRELGSHCPIPVALLFNAKKVLGMSDVCFTNGGFGRANQVPDIGTDVAFLRQMPFRRIYHDTSYPPSEAREMVYRQPAEVIVPGGELELDSLEHVYVRSIAERETLLSLLRDASAVTPSIPLSRVHTIRVNEKAPLFFFHWPYIKRVVVDNDMIAITFNPDVKDTYSFEISMILLSQLSNQIFQYAPARISAIGTVHLPLPKNVPLGTFRLAIVLDDSLAYQHDFSSDPVSDVFDAGF